NFDTDRLRCFDDTGSNDIASYDSAKDINKDRLHVLVREKNAKCVLHLLGRRAATDVEEVRRTAARKLDDVHRAHRQTGAIHHASDIALELDVVQAELAGFDFHRVFFVEI